MRQIIKIITTLSIVLMASTSLAQFTESSLYDQSDINYEIIPTNPNPGENFLIKLSSFSVDINRSNISWISGGVSKKSGVGLKSFNQTSPSDGSNITITAIIETQDGINIQKQITVSSKSMDVLWEVKDGYVPPFYKGKALPTSESRIKVSAMPNKNTLETYIAKWKLNSVILDGGANTGKMSFEYRNSYLKESDEISLEIGSLSNTINTKKIIYIPISEPSILFYKIDGALGTLYNKSLNSMIEMDKNTLIVSAEPYYFSPKSIRDGQLTFKWKVNNSPITTPKKKNILELAFEGGKNGRAEIGLDITSETKLLLSRSAKAPVNINIPQ